MILCKNKIIMAVNLNFICLNSFLNFHFVAIQNVLVSETIKKKDKTELQLL